MGLSVILGVLYARDGGILEPINPDNASVFSRGKAVPVKFKLAGDEPDGFNVLGWTLQKVKVSCTNFDSEEATVEQVAEKPSESFCYDSSADQVRHHRGLQKRDGWNLLEGQGQVG